MKKYTFTCTCGDKMSVDAMDPMDAKVKFAEMMTEEAATAHFAEKHPGQVMPPLADLVAGAVLVEEPEVAMPAPVAEQVTPMSTAEEPKAEEPAA